ncbi:MAG TPA: DNA replication and repair protein RecF [Candidatus Doudnabacteria bacterium]|nr:DNA replication and repair protein RecF [Candidatus Doudnabacteria bacterium]
MQIKKIVLKNFRNYPELELNITSPMVVLSGPNAVGKTNLLESIYFGSLFKSFRDDAEFIFLKNTKEAQIKIEFEENTETHTIEIFLEKRDRIFANFKVNGVKKKRKEAQGFLKVVIFEPSDVELFTKPPEARRKYLNMVLSQKHPEYLELLTNYKKAITQKNKLLYDIKQGLRGDEELDTWNEQLVSFGSEIIWYRKQFINFLNQNLSEVYSNISKFHRTVELVYESLSGDTEEDIMRSYRQELTKHESRERASGLCLVGPHRDDIFLQSEGLYLVSFSSRGEQRSQILALKILELEYLTKEGNSPILLLDDVLSELDDTRRTFLLKYLQGKFQTFITTTHPLEMVGQHVTLSPATHETETEEIEQAN